VPATPASARRDVLIDLATEIETPEHMTFAFRLAGPWQRIGAYLVDVVLRVVVLALLALAASLVGATLGSLSGLMEMGGAVMLLGWFAIEWFWSVLFEWLWDGRTPGKRSFGLRVVRDDGRPIGPREAFLRNLLRAADMLPAPTLFPTYLVGLASAALDPRHRRLGDLAAGTIVVQEEPVRRAEAVTVTPAPSLDELAALPPRPRLSLDERRALEAFVRRSADWTESRRDELSASFARMLAARYGLVPPVSPSRFLQLVYVRASSTAARGAA